MSERAKALREAEAKIHQVAEEHYAAGEYASAVALYRAAKKLREDLLGEKKA